jgi:hypothetical protein
MLYTGERNYGCRFLEVSLFGLRAIILENEKIKVMFILDKGTEIVEFNFKETDTDFIYRSPQGLSCMKKIEYVRKDEQILADNYTGGWFEAFPNVGHGCKYKGANIQDYGEVCYLPWEYSVIKDTPEEVSLKCFVKTTKMPFYVEKVFTVKTNQASLFIKETAVNLGGEDLHFQWGHHPNFGGPFLDESCVIDFPGADISNYLGKRAIHSDAEIKGVWPFLPGNGGEKIDFREMPARGTGVNDILFMKNLKGNWAAVRNRNKKVGIALSWDGAMFDNCLLWMAANGDTGYPRYGQTYLLTILPNSTEVHMLSEGMKLPDAKIIGKGESKTTWLTVTAFKDHGEVSDMLTNGEVIFK